MTEREASGLVRLTGPTAVERLRTLAHNRSRAIVGLCGPPGAGKSTLGTKLVSELGAEVASLLPMDGFHLANATLRREGLSEMKGAINTFDVRGYAAILARLFENEEDVVYAPEFDRDLDEAVAAAITIPRATPLVVIEGNYLLAGDELWAAARKYMNEVWYLEVDQDLRRQRLVTRHMQFGRSRAQAENWVHTVDEVNARAIAATSHRSDAAISPWDDRVGVNQSW